MLTTGEIITIVVTGVGWVVGLLIFAFIFGKRLQRLESNDKALDTNMSKLAAGQQELRDKFDTAEAERGHDRERLVRLETGIAQVAKIDVEVGVVSRDLGSARVEFATSLGELRGMLLRGGGTR